MKLFKKTNKLFALTVLIPTFCAFFYFSFWASDIYISESSFVVRSPNNQAALSGMGAVLQNVGFSRSQDDSYTVREYMTSRNALSQLEQKLPLREFYNKGDIFSRFAPFGIGESNEEFFRYFRHKESVSLDSVSGITTLRIRAFDAEAAQQINMELLQQGETLINRLNERARHDTIAFAEQAVQEATTRVEETANALTQYRINNVVFDVQAQSEVQLALISKLQSELINIQTQLDQVRSISPANPQVKTLKAREASIQEEMQKQIQQVLGGGDSTANQTAEYQRLVLDNTLAQQQLTSAMTTLHNTKNEAERQQLYLEVIEQPSKPDFAVEPYRLYNILATLIIGLMLYGILTLLLASIKEHKN
ncbi:capsule biosynthesis protein [Pelistega ratti]|uniref:capsule biosynthesis protein n=1 Tax=Pelistega ratti TaxID=2652177 RepID=UPI00135AC58D|nr:capsule biosynthesis protein [Pelistega ratti]